MKRKLIVFVSALLILGCSGFRGLTFRITTNAMAPTLKIGDTIFCDPLFYKHSPVARGDIVIVKDPTGRKGPDGNVEIYPKRVIALGGDKVQVMSDKVYVSGRVVDGILGSGKSFTTDRPVEDFGPVIVPPGEYFLVGDNLANSFDSRYWTPPTVKLEAIYGKVTQIQDHETKEIRDL